MNNSFTGGPEDLALEEFSIKKRKEKPIIEVSDYFITMKNYMF